MAYASMVENMFVVSYMGVTDMSFSFCWNNGLGSVMVKL